LALLRRQARIARLGDGGAERIEHAWILPPACEAAKLLVHTGRILPRELRNRLDPEHFDVTGDPGTYGYQVTKSALFRTHGKFSLTRSQY